MSIAKDRKRDGLVRSRMNTKRKQHVEVILRKLGLNHSEAINLFYAQIESLKDLPFDIHVPNAATAKVLRDSKKGINVTTYNSKEKFFKDLGL